MQDYIDFLLNHWQLAAGLLILIVMFVLNELREHLFGTPRVTPRQLVDLMNHHGGTVLDIRSVQDYEKGHILGATHMPQSELANSTTQLEPFKNKPLILVCANGQHSALLGAKLRKQGFTQVSCLLAGMQKWDEEGLPKVR